MMGDFLCQPDWDKICTDILFTVTLDVSAGMFGDKINI